MLQTAFLFFRFSFHFFIFILIRVVASSCHRLLASSSTLPVVAFFCYHLLASSTPSRVVSSFSRRHFLLASSSRPRIVRALWRRYLLLPSLLIFLVFVAALVRRCLLVFSSPPCLVFATGLAFASSCRGHSGIVCTLIAPLTNGTDCISLAISNWAGVLVQLRGTSAYWVLVAVERSGTGAKLDSTNV